MATKAQRFRCLQRRLAMVRNPREYIAAQHAADQASENRDPLLGTAAGRLEVRRRIAAAVPMVDLRTGPRGELQGYGQEFDQCEKEDVNYQELIDQAFDQRWGVFWAWVQDAQARWGAET